MVEYLEGVGYPYPPPESRPLPRSVRILLECFLVILVSSKQDHHMGSFVNHLES